jgi:hypothetical protein
MLYIHQDKSYEDLTHDEINWVFVPHTHFSMIKKGKMPKGMSKADLEPEITGTFGGRFHSFDSAAGTFEYVAYTD